MSRINSICGLLLCAAFLTACSSGETTSSELPTPSAANYKTVTVERGSFELVQKSGGSFVYPVTDSVICEYDHATLKEELAVHRGSEVKKGDVLATFTFDVSNAELKKMELAYLDAVSAVEEKEQQFRNQIAGYSVNLDGSDGKIAALQKEQTENEWKLYQITSAQELEKAKKELEEYRSYFSEKTVTAPCDGVVSSVETLIAGREVAKGTKLLTIYSPEAVYFKLSSPTKDMLQLAAPHTAVTITSGKWTSSGKIASTPTGIDDPIDNQDVYIAIDHPQGIPQSGSPSVECVSLKLDHMLLLDRRAVRTDTAVDYVLILENGVSLKRNVLCGPENSDVVCILDGLSEGQQVILN